MMYLLKIQFNIRTFDTWIMFYLFIGELIFIIDAKIFVTKFWMLMQFFTNIIIFN